MQFERRVAVVGAAWPWIPACAGTIDYKHDDFLGSIANKTPAERASLGRRIVARKNQYVGSICYHVPAVAASQ